MIDCEFRVDGNCAIASEWAGRRNVPAQEDACKVCIGCDRPKQLNRVTVSIALNRIKEDSEEEYQAMLIEGGPYLSKVTMTESFVRYTNATAEWIALGMPERTDEEVAAIVDTCQTKCEQFIGDGSGAGRCKLCGCSINLYGGMFNKARRANEHCPIGKW